MNPLPAGFILEYTPASIFQESADARDRVFVFADTPCIVLAWPCLDELMPAPLFQFRQHRLMALANQLAWKGKKITLDFASCTATHSYHHFIAISSIKNDALH
jgi:hypothetical protein